MRHRIGVLVIALLPGMVTAQESVAIYREISPEQIEKLLRELSINFKRSEGKEKGEAEYTFLRNNFKLSLTYYGGKDLMLSGRFSAAALETINAWNQGARFSRAVLYGSGKNAYSTLEANLDCLAGVSEGQVKYFISSFDSEVRRFDNFLSQLDAGNEVYTSLPDARLERLLSSLKITYKKSADPSKGAVHYDFTKGGHEIRLTNFGGRDLMLEVLFSDAALEKVNQYNAERKFIRVARHRGADGQSHVSVAANLDCVGGVTDNIIVRFLQTFDEEVQAFARFLTR